MHLNALQSQKGATYRSAFKRYGYRGTRILIIHSDYILVREENLSKRISREPRHLKGNVKLRLHSSTHVSKKDKKITFVDFKSLVKGIIKEREVFTIS